MKIAAARAASPTIPETAAWTPDGSASAGSAPSRLAVWRTKQSERNAAFARCLPPIRIRIRSDQDTTRRRTTLNTKHRDKSAGTMDSSFVRRFWLCSAASLLAASLLGCSAPNKPGTAPAAKSGPIAVFDDVCARSLTDDAEFVRSKIAPQLLMQEAGGPSGPRADKFVRDMMDLWRVCRPIQEEKGGSADKVILLVAGVKESTVRQYRIDMSRDQQHGWQIASKLYDEKPIPPANPQKP
jgi:hypothetical protein